MRALVVAEHDTTAVRSGSYSAVTFARLVAGADSDVVQLLILGQNVEQVAAAATGVVPVLLADHESLKHPIADRYAMVIDRVVRSGAFDVVVAASTTFARDVVGRAAGLLGGSMASDVVGHEFRDDRLLLKRPMYASSVLATVALLGRPQIIMIRPSAYAPATIGPKRFGVERVEVNAAEFSSRVVYEGNESRAMTRPDLTEARAVVSGGRAFRDSDEFEMYVGALADKLGGACGCTRALVDAGITPNELQVGQTGKVVAPELYFALGLSGSVQHLAGMKNSKIVVAINNDPEAPIFDVANYGLVADVREAVPKLIEELGNA
jgi:electron transfer flavoprotein alpha subunit